MSTIFLSPQTFTVVDASQQSIAPASNLNVARPARVWRSTTTTAFVTATLSEPLDTIVLADSNLRASADVRVRVGPTRASVEGNSAPVDRTIKAWRGSAPAAGAQTLIVLEALVTGPWLRIDISDPGNPAGYLQAGRLVAGKRVSCDGVDHNAERTWEQAAADTLDPQPVRRGWRVTLSNLSDAVYYRDWEPLVMRGLSSRDLWFAPEVNGDHLQVQAMLCRLSGSAPKGTSKASDYNILDLQLLSEA